MNSITRHLVSGMALAASVALSAQAAPIQYSEATGGDLEWNGSTTFKLDAGVNTVSGTENARYNSVTGQWLGYDSDAFHFKVLAGMQVTGISLEWRNFNANAGLYTGAGHLNGFYSCSLLDAGSNVLATQGASWTNECSAFGSAASGNVALFTAQMPLGEGTYGWDNVLGLQSWRRSSDAAYSVDYTVSLTVERIASLQAAALPEPGSLALVGLAVAGLAFSRRRVG